MYVRELVVRRYKIFMRYVGAHFNSAEEMGGTWDKSESDKNANLVQTHLNNLWASHANRDINNEHTDSRCRCRSPTRTADIGRVDRRALPESIAPKTGAAVLTCSSIRKILRLTETWLVDCSLELASPASCPSRCGPDMELWCPRCSNFVHTYFPKCEPAVARCG